MESFLEIFFILYKDNVWLDLGMKKSFYKCFEVYWNFLKMIFLLKYILFIYVDFLKMYFIIYLYVNFVFLDKLMCLLNEIKDNDMILNYDFNVFLVSNI